MAEMEKEPEYITLEFEDGGTLECEVLGTFTVGEREYVALYDDGEDIVYFYRYLQSDEDHYEIADIETDEEFEAVSAEFDEITDPGK